MVVTHNQIITMADKNIVRLSKSRGMPVLVDTQVSQSALASAASSSPATARNCLSKESTTCECLRLGVAELSTDSRLVSR